MNKASMVAIVLIVLILGIVVVATQIQPGIGTNQNQVTATPKSTLPASNSGVGANSGDNSSAPTAANLAAQSKVASVTTGKLSDIAEDWYASHFDTYAGFATNADNLKKIRDTLTESATTMDFYVNSSQTNYVVRTHVPLDQYVYCLDKSLATPAQSKFTNDTDFRAATDCSGKKL